MNSAERNHQSMMASVYVFAIMMVAYYAGQLVMNTFGISIPGLRIAGGLIVAFIGFRMLFPAQKRTKSPEATSKSEELESEPSANIAFVPLAMPSTAGPGTIAMIISSASTVRDSSTFPDWVLTVAPPLILRLLGLSCGRLCAVPVRSCAGWARAVSRRFPSDGLLTGLYGRAVYY